MTGCIIAAGEGSRLLQEGCSISKPMIKINGIPMVGRLLAILSDYGFDEVNIIINEYTDDVFRYLSDVKDSYNFKLNIIRKTTSSSMHSLYELSKTVHDKAFHLFTVDSVFYKNEFQHYLKFCQNSTDKYDAIMAVTKYIDDEKPLYAEIKGVYVTAFLDKTDSPNYITSGFYYFNRDISYLLKKQVDSGSQRLRNFLRQLTAENFNIGYYEFSKTIDVDHIEDIKKAEIFINEVKS